MYTNTVLPEMPVRRLESIIKSVQRHSAPSVYLAGSKGKLYDVSKSSNYEGWPFTDSFTLRCFPKNTDPYDYKTLQWTLAIGYVETSGEVYDYVATTEKDNSTAFKLGRPGPKQQTKFKIDDKYLVSLILFKELNYESLLVADLLILEKELVQLDNVTQNILNWAESGFDLLAFCKSALCYKSSIIPNSTITRFAERGLSLGDFKELLVCTRCGARDPKIIPSTAT